MPIFAANDDAEPTILPVRSDAKKKKSSEIEIITKVPDALSTRFDINDRQFQTPMVTLSGHRDAIAGTCWSPTSEKEVITVSWDHSIIIWDLELAGIVQRFHQLICKLILKTFSTTAI
jgi:WD40 repeat protein